MVFVECLRNKVDQNFTKFVNNQKICKQEYCTMKNSKDYLILMNIG